jgi:hypothetical protein
MNILKDTRIFLQELCMLALVPPSKLHYNVRFNSSKRTAINSLSQEVTKPAKTHNITMHHTLFTNALQLLRIREQQQYIVIGFTLQLGEE